MSTQASASSFSIGVASELERGDPARADLLPERAHDRSEQLLLRPDQPVDGARAEPGGGRDVADGRGLVAAAAELGARDGADVRGLLVVAGFADVAPRLDDPVHRDEGLRPVELRVADRPAGQALEQDAAEDRGDLIGGGVVPDDVEPDVQRALAEAVRQRGEVDVRADVLAAPAGAQRREHRLLDRGGRALRELDELLVRGARRLVEGELQRGAMADGAARDRRAELDDPLGDGLRGPARRASAADLSDAIEIGVIAPDQLDQDGFLGLEVVIEAARQDAGGVGDLLEGGAQAGGRDQGRGRVEDLGAARSVAGLLRLRTPPASRPES